MKNATPKTLRFPDGSLLTLRDYVYPMVDIYCYLNGYFDMNRKKLVNDYDITMSRRSRKHNVQM